MGQVKTPLQTAKRTEEAYKLNLVLFSRSADQEFALSPADKRRKMWHDSYGDWDDHHPGWDNGGVNWDNYSNSWDNHGATQAKEIKATRDGPALGRFVQLRQDNEEHGFVANMKTGVVFLADAQTIAMLRSLLSVPIRQLEDKHPEVLDALGKM